MAAAASPWMDDELSMFADHASRFIGRELAPHAERWEREGLVDRAGWLKAGEGGLLCVSIPEAYGGGGGTLAHEAVVIQELSRGGLMSGLGAGHGVSCGIVAHYILTYGTEEQKLRWLPKMATGEYIGAVAMTEPGTGSDLQAVRTTATPVDGGWRVTGQKTFISNGQNADLVVVVARTGGAGSKGLSLLVLETEGAEGFRRGRNLEKVGLHAQDTSELFFDDVFIPTANLLGGVEGQGFVHLMQQLAWERLICALQAVTSMELAVELTTAYVKERKAFGKAILDFQNTQFKLAECKTQAAVGRAFVDRQMVQLLAGQLDAADAAMAKWWTTDMQGKVIDECLQLHGGYGYMAEYPIARMWADARVSRIYGGTNEIMKLIISRTL